MPAVELVRLRAQVHDLLAHFAEPAVFQRKLNDLLDLYANRAFRPGQTSPHQSNLPGYQPATLVMRELQIALTRQGRLSGGAALRVVNVLRSDPMLEPRLLAAHLLGSIDPAPVELVLEQIRAWCTPEEDRQTLDSALDSGCLRLRAEAETTWLAMIEAWIMQPDIDYRRIALRAMLPAFKDPRFINLPPLLSMLSPLLLAPPPALFGDLQDILLALIQRSPAEAVFYLRQMLSLSKSAHTARLARRLLPTLPAKHQDSLRMALRAFEAHD